MFRSDYQNLKDRMWIEILQDFYHHVRVCTIENTMKPVTVGGEIAIWCFMRPLIPKIMGNVKPQSTAMPL